MSFAPIFIMCYQLPYIGVRGICEDETPQSGLWINDLPGITFRRAALTANEEDVTAKAFLDRIEALAIDLVKKDFIQALSPSYQFNKIVKRQRVGYYLDTYETKASGVGIEIKRDLDEMYGSIYLQSVDIYSESEDEITITVTDGIETEVSDVTVSGLKNVCFDFETTQEKITVTIDGGTLRKSSSSKNCDVCDCMTVRGIDENGDYVSDLNGMRVHVQSRCSEEILLCQYENILRYPILYKMGILFLDEGMYSDRVNRFLNNSKDQLERLKVEWNGGVDPQTGFSKKGEYWRHLNNGIAQIKESLKLERSVCLSCKSFRKVSTIP